MKLFTFLALFSTLLAAASSPVSAQDFAQWSAQQYEVAKTRLLQNVSPAGSVPGSVVASPSKQDPDYYYHWVRDAALVMTTLERLRQVAIAREGHDLESEAMLRHLFDFVDVTRLHQQRQTPAGLGEVKYHVDANPFTGSWGRPQNDGPALRAMVLIKLANYLLANNGEAYVREVLYDGRLPAESVIKKDLEYVSHNWKNHDFDLWEECMGHHFFTRLAQRRALLEGAKLARRLGDRGAADWYEQQARALEVAINLHWDGSMGLFKATLNRVGGIDYKGGMDSSVIIAIIETEDKDDSAIRLTDERFQSSVQKMNETFRRIYSINRNTSLGMAIGRYPEDQYDGYHTGKIGNPWFITTAAFASYHYRLARAVAQEGKIEIGKHNAQFFNAILGKQFFTPGMKVLAQDAQFKSLVHGLIDAGDNYMKRIQYHSQRDGSLSEQMNRESGHMQGAAHLTWSYSSFINAYLDRKDALKVIR